jgi:hypothetical protein
MTRPKTSRIRKYFKYYEDRNISECQCYVIVHVPKDPSSNSSNQTRKRKSQTSSSSPRSSRLQPPGPDNRIRMQTDEPTKKKCGVEIKVSFSFFRSV